jgi:hypothetical protein
MTPCREADSFSPEEQQGAIMNALRLKVLAATFAASLATPALAGDPVLEWNSIMVTTTATQNPFAQARFAAITQLAVFEAMNAIRRDYDPYLGTVDAPHWASTHAAAVSAAHGVLKTYFPANAAALDAARATSLAAIAEGPARTAGIAAGEAAAAALVAHRNGDGSAPPAFHLPQSTAIGEWQTTPACPAAGGILAHWDNLQPFGIESMDQFRSPRPPSITSKRYTKDYEEVKRVGGVNSTHRSQDRADVARFYAAALAVPVWNSAATQVAIAQGRSSYENARALALLNAAMSDALASVMETKYVYRFWRPETAIRAGDTDGNSRTHGDATFAPFVVTPCFPSYGSAHASAAGAARELLERFYGPRRHAITITTPSLPDLTLQYRSFEQIANDIDDARVYGGIHFRFDQETGAAQGRKIGTYVHRNLLRRSFWWCWL